MDISDKLRLKEMAEEDIYFARRDQALIRALHEEKSAEHLDEDARKKDKQAVESQEEYTKEIKKRCSGQRKFAQHYRKLIEQVLELLKRLKAS